ncbi:hypothetical protein FIE12Z_5241 [Fusarium flagelliforme]|uniref:Uncharacterized protein n=1 Tax=Fusarium flagelliforme TaxID=2675880 RepID=A0A395MR78_9HYPO|nr:hypothetical protein FIE12Z_5241 [Fusarium flagelliforme]
MSALPSAQCEVARRRVEIAEKRRDASKHQVQGAQLQLEASQMQREDDEADLEAARTQLRAEELRMPENSGSGHGNNLPAPEAAPTTAPVGDSPGYGHRRNRGGVVYASRSGRGGRDPRSSSANNVGVSGRGSFAGVSKNNPTPNTRTSIPQVPEVEEPDRTDGSDRTVMGVSSTSLGGRYRYDFAASTASTPARVSGSTSRWQDGNEIFQRALKDLGEDSLDFEFKTWQKGQLSFVKRRPAPTRVIKSTGNDGPTAEESALQRQIALSSSGQRTCCTGCGKDHALKDCLFAPNGFIVGCTLCNTRDHAVDTCEQFKVMSKKEKARLLVYDRGNQPMLETSPKQPGSYWHLRQYLEEAGEDTAVPNEFPWTYAFAKDVRRRPDFIAIQSKWITDRDVDALPKDPIHDTWEAMNQLYWNDSI